MLQLRIYSYYENYENEKVNRNLKKYTGYSVGHNRAYYAFSLVPIQSK